jgi:hypothetical protein
MNAAQKRVERALAGALSRVDELWSAEALAGVVERNSLLGTPAVLRELLIDALASELELQIMPERFEALLDAVRMSTPAAPA